MPKPFSGPVSIVQYDPGSRLYMYSREIDLELQQSPHMNVSDDMNGQGCTAKGMQVSYTKLHPHTGGYKKLHPHN